MEKICANCLFYNPFYQKESAGTCQQRFEFEEFAAVSSNDSCEEWTEDDGK